jgi:hypothetical protein
MSSFLTQAWLMDRHGLRLDLEALAKVLDSTPANLRRRISANDFDIRTYIDGGKRWADVRDVAKYLDDKREQARAAVESSGTQS